MLESTKAAIRAATEGRAWGKRAALRYVQRRSVNNATGARLLRLARQLEAVKGFANQGGVHND